MLIRIRENEFKPILDRERVQGDIKKHLGPWLNLLRDVINYGTNLIPRSFASSERKFRDVLVVGVFLRQVVAMLDAVEILLSSGSPHAANLQMRALLEAYVYIEWILESDSEKKASYYYVHNLRRKRLWGRRAERGSQEWQDFVAVMGTVKVQPTAEASKSVQDQVKEIDRVLGGPKFDAINKEFEKLRKERRREPAWYVPLGPKSFAALTRAVHKESLYAIFYSTASEVTHTSNYDHHVKINGDKVTFQPIRYLEGFEKVLRFSASVAIMTYMRILREYRPDERAAFGRKYQENWQKEFMNFLDIKYKGELTEI